jgi:hypothetical protein
MTRIAKLGLIIAGLLFILCFCFGGKVWGAQWEEMGAYELGQLGAWLGHRGCVVAVKEGRVDRETGAVELRVYDLSLMKPCIYTITTLKKNILNIDVKILE